MLKVATYTGAVKHNELETLKEEMKASPSQLHKEVEQLKHGLLREGLSEAEYWKARQELAHLLESLLLIDLDYALDKKVEQDLWSFVFRNPIAACQSKAKEQKSSSNVYSKSQLTTLLETASGFYLQLLQKLCCAYDIDLPCHPRDSVYGLTKESISRCYPCARKPHKSSLFYICQHCLVHLGDIARYRGQSLQAENFYRHAVDLVPSNGQPYNQLALLEAASGEKLSTVFFYMRSLAVQHPFPLAGTNLQTLFSKMSSDGTGIEGKIRMTAFEYMTVFLQFHAAVHLNSDIKKAENMLNQLTTSLPALIIAEKFETWQLVQMVAVCLFAIEHAWDAMELEKSSHGLQNGSLSLDEMKAATLIQELLSNLLYAFLLPIHASLDPKETATYYTLPAVKIIVDWFLQGPNFVQREPLIRKPQIWHAMCKLLNDLDVVSTEPYDAKKFEGIPLPEDWDLQCFLPLKDSQRQLKFNLSAETPSDEESVWLRAVRLCHSGETLTKKNGLNLLSVSHSGGRRHFRAINHTEAISEQVLQQIQELSVTTTTVPCNGLPQPPETSTYVYNGGPPAMEHSQPSVRSKGSHQEGTPQQEVRFKLDDVQQRKDKLEERDEKLERRSKEASFPGAVRRMGKNVAMQAIFQQRASQNSGLINSVRPSEYGKEPSVLQKDVLVRQQSLPPPHIDASHQMHSVQDGSCLQSQVMQELQKDLLVRQQTLPPSHMDASHPLHSMQNGNCMPSQVMQEVNLNRGQLHHLQQDQYGSLQAHQQQKQQTIDIGTSVDRADSHWLQPFNIHQNGIPSVNQVVRSSSMNNYVQNTVPHIIPPHQSASEFTYHQAKNQTQTPHIVNKPSSAPQQAFLANPQNMMWNYMNFVASFQQVCNGSLNSSSHQVVMQAGNDHHQASQLHSQAPNYFLMNNGVHQKLQPVESSIQQTVISPFRNGPGGDSVGMAQPNSGIFHDKPQDQSTCHQLPNSLWKQENGHPADVLQNHFPVNQVVSRAVGQALQSAPQNQMRDSAAVTSGGHHDIGSNTYSLFNSPWPSGLSVPRANKESQHHGNVEAVVVQPRVQSLWSGPGPSPLERLLEQQKQRRDATTL